MDVLTTIPPYAPYLDELARHPIVSGFRLNTVMPLKESLDDLLSRLKTTARGKPVWIDLKGRQLRVSRGEFYNTPTDAHVIEVEGKKILLDPSNPKTYGELKTPPWSVITIDHEIELDTTRPVRCYFNDGIDSAMIVGVDRNKLIMLDGPQRVVGGGESINILHPSLSIKGYLTDLDRRYIEAGKKTEVHSYMLSYVEKDSDITDVLALDPQARIVAKIESEKGLKWMRERFKDFPGVHLMAATGDLYVEVSRPHRILNAVRSIREADPGAIAASRLFGSLRSSSYPSYSDICAVGWLREIGYKTMMVGDDVCFKRDSVLSALNLAQSINTEYVPRGAPEGPQ